MTTESDRREEILKAAMKVFAEQGYHKASIKQIAKAAELKSTSHIYWYFEDKKALFNAVITELSPLRNVPVLQQDFQQVAYQMPPRELMTLLLSSMLSLQDDPDTVTIMRVYLSEAFRQPDIADAISGFQSAISGFLDGYLQHQIDTGNLRPHNVSATARMLLGAGFINLMAHQVFTGLAAGFPDRETYVKAVVEALLDGLNP